MGNLGQWANKPTRLCGVTRVVKDDATRQRTWFVVVGVVAANFRCLRGDLLSTLQQKTFSADPSPCEAVTVGCQVIKQHCFPPTPNNFSERLQQETQ